MVSTCALALSRTNWAKAIIAQRRKILVANDNGWFSITRYQSCGARDLIMSACANPSNVQHVGEDRTLWTVTMDASSHGGPQHC